MTEKIKEHIDQLLKDAPRTRRILDLQEELLSGCLDKYADLLASGSGEQDAYDAVIAGIGDVDELIGASKKKPLDQNLLGPVSSSLWSLTMLAYLCLGFLFDFWHPGWLVFPIGAVLQVLLVAAFKEPGNRKGPLTGALYIAASVVFLVFGLWTNQWHIAVLVFAFAVALQQIMRLARAWGRDE